MQYFLPREKYCRGLAGSQKKRHLSRNPAEGPVMLSIGIVGVLCNVLCLVVLQKQQVSDYMLANISSDMWKLCL